MDKYLCFGGDKSNTIVTGASHVQSEKECQDFASYKRYEYAEGKYRDASNLHKSFTDKCFCDAIAVADGHGSTKHFRSAKGSKFAVCVFFEILENFFEVLNEEEISNIQEMSEHISRIPEILLAKWNDRIKCDVDENPYTPEELSLLKDTDKEKANNRTSDSTFYGSTFIGLIRFRTYWACINIGDGDIVIHKNDSIENLFKQTEEEQIGEGTYSLCNINAIEKFNIYISEPEENFPIAMYIMTDGIFKSYRTKEAFFDFFKRLTSAFNENDIDDVLISITKNLEYTTKKGSGDDISICGIVKEFDTKKNYTK